MPIKQKVLLTLFPLAITTTAYSIAQAGGYNPQSVPADTQVTLEDILQDNTMRDFDYGFHK